MNQLAKWERIKTSKRYLHPPFSGYFCTQWPDFKVILSKFETKCAPNPSYSAYGASGIRVLVGQQLESVDFKNTHFGTRDDGAPIHGMLNVQPGFALHMENFCNTDTKRPTIYTRITVANESDAPVTDMLGILVRSGAENLLTGTQVDGYITYDGNVANWGFAQPTWVWDGDKRLLDEKNGCAIEIDGNEGFHLSWHGKEKGYVWHQRHLLKAEFTLQPNEQKSLTLRLHYLDADQTDGDYDAQRKQAIEFWHKELSRIRQVPGKPEHAPVVFNLTAQLLQHFASYLDEGFIAPRQGGMNRFFWSVEAMEFLMALDRMGDFDDYNRTAYDFFFDHCQTKEGEGAGEVILTTAWGSTTAGAVRACAYHILHRDAQEYRRYREPLYLAFQWIQRQRAKSTQQGSLYTGIFPSMRGTDWPGEFQSWCMTDGHSLQAMGVLADAFEKHGDPCASEIRQAYNDYMACMKDILAREVAKNTDPEELLLPNRLGIPQTDPPMGAYQGDGPAMLLQCGVMDPNSVQTQMVENFFRNRNCWQRGLHGLMCDGRLRPNKDTDSVAGHTWYLSTCDMRWFYTYLAQGKKDRAEETVNALLNYGMSDAYQIAERFADCDPYYMPWQPNASGNGRLLMMLADLYGMQEMK